MPKLLEYVHVYVVVILHLNGATTPKCASAILSDLWFYYNEVGRVSDRKSNIIQYTFAICKIVNVSTLPFYNTINYFSNMTKYFFFIFNNFFFVFRFLTHSSISSYTIILYIRNINAPKRYSSLYRLTLLYNNVRNYICMVNLYNIIYIYTILQLAKHEETSA